MTMNRTYKTGPVTCFFSLEEASVHSQYPPLYGAKPTGQQRLFTHNSTERL